MKFTFFKTHQHRVFNYQPIFYDEAKSEMDERRRSVRTELGLDQEEDKTTHADRIRGKMNHRIKNSFEVTRKEKRKSSLRLIVIIAILFIIAYYLFLSSSEWILKYM